MKDKNEEDIEECEEYKEPFAIKAIHVVITTNDQFIDGELVLPENVRFRNSTPDNMLFYFLNGGFQFITLKNCEIKDRKNLAFRPDLSPILHIRVTAIVTIQIINYEDDEDEKIKKYNSKMRNSEDVEESEVIFNCIEIDKTRPQKPKRRTKKSTKPKD